MATIETSKGNVEAFVVYHKVTTAGSHLMVQFKSPLTRREYKVLVADKRKLVSMQAVITGSQVPSNTFLRHEALAVELATAMMTPEAVKAGAFAR